MRIRSADVAVERQVRGVGCRMGHRQRDAEDRVGAELAFVVGAVEVQHGLVHQPLLAGLVAHQLRSELVDHPQHGFANTFAAVPAVDVAQLNRLERSRGCAGGHRGAALGSVVEDDLHLDGGVAARVEDLAGADELDTGHLEHAFRQALPDGCPSRLSARGPATDQAGGCVYGVCLGSTAHAGRQTVGGRRRMAAATFTPTIPAQATSTPTIPGSTTLPLIAVMGTPTPNETMPSTNRWVRDSFSALARWSLRSASRRSSDARIRASWLTRSSSPSAMASSYSRPSSRRAARAAWTSRRVSSSGVDMSTL